MKTQSSLLFVSMLLLAACEPAACEPGTPGCPCAMTEVPCTSGTFCVAGTCREPSCVQGQEGCACYGNFTCDRGGDGRYRVCQDGLCREAACPQGALGCGCYSDGSCDAGHLCDDSDGVARCQLPGCEVGDLDCGCRADRTCSATDEGERLACVEGVCRAPTCEQGTTGCACNADYSCERGALCQDGTCEVIACTPGTISCACRHDDSCDGALSCTSGRCVDPSCAEGEEGCGCLPGDACTAGGADEILACRGGRCEAEACTDGTDGCACLPGGECVTGGSTCVSGRCQSGACTAGAENCPCGSGGTCGDGLLCAEGSRCVDGAGFPGYACRADETCNRGSRCDRGVCAPCVIGSESCGCYESGSCTRGLACVEGMCVSEVGRARPIPVDPACYTPCREDYVDGTTPVRCSSEGLMRRCREGTTCREGSCLPDGASAPSCVSDVDCPDFQACIRGRCYSECNDDTECSLGTRCHRHVCRLECRTDTTSCPAGSHCASVDGENGFCMPVRDPAGADARSSVDGTFTLSASSLELSNIRTTAEITLTNDSGRSLEFVLRKVEHTEPGIVAPVTTTPLDWLSIGAGGSASRVPEVRVRVDANASVTLDVRDAATTRFSSWQGVLEVVSDDLGAQRIALSYRERPDGQWAGTMYYLANFGTEGLDGWMASRDSAAELGRVGNALVRIWGDLRTRSGGVTFPQMKSALIATTRGDLFDLNDELDPTTRCDVAVCYPYTTAAGGVALGRYTDNTDVRPVPSGVTQFPIAMNLRADPAMANVLRGRIETGQSLQYPGNPSISLTFGSNPATCSPVSGGCATYLTGLDAAVRLGGRYPAPSSSRCNEHGTGFELATIPWLVPGFVEGSDLEATSGARYRYECRDTILPFGSDPALAARNASFSLGNPLPDGRAQGRHIELIDGALFNQDELIVLFRERFDDSLLGEPMTQRFAAHGFMVLSRTPADLDEPDFAGGMSTATRPSPAGILGSECAPDLVERVLGAPAAIGAANASALARGVVEGVRPSSTAPVEAAPGTVHYLCGDTGLFDRGSRPSEPEACPAGSPVTYFLSTLDDAQIAAEPCNAGGTCGAVLERWAEFGSHGVALDPIWRCTGSAVYCDANRQDLRDGKTFYVAGPDEPVFVPLVAAIEGAFRYRTRFRSRGGAGVGFTPELCPPGVTTVPYCYDAAAIEAVRARVDCATHLFTAHYASLGTDTQALLRNTLIRSFAYENEPGIDQPVSNEGFERLYAQLLIMLGDDAYTAAFASRFDLAGSSLVSFEGSAFEPGGIDLSGAAGFEMYSLYRATQTYQLVLDRFFENGPALWASINEGAGSPENFVTQETVVSYFDRVVRASVQKSRAWSAVAQRYTAFNRPDLARLVVERAYSAAYLESIILSRMMIAAVSVADPAKKAQIQLSLEDAQRLYRVALLEMRDLHASIADGITYFGYAPDYIPFPALDPGDVNAFTRTLGRARSLASIARSAEDVALTSSRSYETDAAAFQSELVQIRNTYESQLGDVCGTFTGRDGRVYPAVPLYARLDDRARIMRNPCGLMGNGRLHEALAGLEIAALDMRAIDESYDALFEEIRIEEDRVNAQCDLTARIAEYEYEQAGAVATLSSSIRASQNVQAGLRRVRSNVEQISNLSKCTIGLATDCPTAAMALVQFTSVAFALDVTETAIEVSVSQRQNEIDQINRSSARWRTERACDSALIDSNARVLSMLLRLKQLDVDALRQQYRVQLAAAGVEELRNQSTRLLAEREESEALRIDVEAARNDPNVRIYRNDAIINADRTFHNAVREAYRATRVYEYYTSSSYPRLDTLFLVRLVARGDYSLERYLDELDEAYDRFRETYGTPDVRVAVLSLRDDILEIPRVGDDEQAIAQSERIDRLREAVLSPQTLDQNGYRTISFPTTLDALSPLTRNHKILYVEAEIIGSRVGDTVGRVYLRQAGTALVRPLDGDDLYYRLPERTAVINTFFNGTRAFGPEVYRSERLRDRPFINTYWELVLNQRDERANQDIDLDSLTDIRLYVYYSDFTAL